MTTRPLSRPVTEQELSSYSSTFAEINNLPPVPPAQFQFFAAFDGTWNDRTNLDLAGTKQPTNVAQLEDLVGKNDTSGVTSRYYAGIGTSGIASQYIGGSIGPQYEAVAKAQAAYQDLIQQADKWQAANPGQPLDVSVSMVAFSRGGASALLLARMLNERGVPDLSSAYEAVVVGLGSDDNITRTETRYSRNLIEPGNVPVASMVLYDPVATGVLADMRLTDNVRDVAVFVADNEQRASFAALQLSDPSNPDPRVHVYKNAGAHTDQGGGYDNGLGALNLALGHLYLERNGTAAAPIPAELAFDPEVAVVHNSSVGLFAGDWVEVRPVRVEWSTDPVRQSTPSVPLVQTEFSPLGDDLYLKSTIDHQGRISAQVVDAQGNMLLQAQDGNLLTRDPATGYIKVTDTAGTILRDYTPNPTTTANPANPADTTDSGSAGAVNGADHQSDTYLSLLELSASELASYFASASASASGQSDLLRGGYYQFKDLYGQTVHVDSAGHTLSQEGYEQSASGQAAAPVEMPVMPVMPGTLVMPTMEFFEARWAAMQTFAQQVETNGLPLVSELVTALQSDNQAAMRAALGQVGAWGQQVNSELSALMAGLNAADLGGGYSAAYGAGGGTQTDPLPAVDPASWPAALLAGQSLSQASAWHYTVPADMPAPRPAGAYAWPASVSLLEHSAWPASVSLLEHSAWSFDGMRSALSDDDWADTLNYLATDALTGAPPVSSEGSLSLAHQLTGKSAANVNDLLLYWAGNAQNSVTIQDVFAQSSVVTQALIESVKFDNRAAWGVGALL